MALTFTPLGTTEELRAYYTEVPGLVLFRTASGWHVGQQSTGGWWGFHKTKDDAKFVTNPLRGRFDFGRERWPLRQEVRAAILGPDLPVKAFEMCGVMGSEGRCLNRAGHTDAHKRAGKAWRDG
jgi:hypothetical protein